MMSGLAAAERLGADYPFPHDKLASAQVTTKQMPFFTLSSRPASSHILGAFSLCAHMLMHLRSLKCIHAWKSCAKQCTSSLCQSIPFRLGQVQHAAHAPSGALIVLRP